MGIISLVIPQIGQPDTTEDVKLQNALTTIQTVINGNIDSTNLSAATAQSAGINASGQTMKGSVIIPGQQTTGSTTFTTLATPDQVTGIVLPAAGILVIYYRAIWSNSVAGAGAAAIFIGANQLVVDAGASGPAPVQVTGPGFANTGNGLVASTNGLVTSNSGTAIITGDATTGQAFVTESFGGNCPVFAAAGTYSVSVQFKASSGTISVSNRRLYVQAISFA